MAFAEIFLAGYSRQSRAGKIAPSCPLITSPDLVHLARSRSLQYNKFLILTYLNFRPPFQRRVYCTSQQRASFGNQSILNFRVIKVRETRLRSNLLKNINLLLTEREGRTGEYWPEVVTVRTERSEVRTKRPIFLSTARASQVSKQFIIWHSGHACLFSVKTHFRSLEFKGLPPCAFEEKNKLPRV